MGAHQSPRMQSCVWLTPPAILTRLGSFDLDPCAASLPRPWPTAAAHLTAEDDGLSVDWWGRVWLNPPYGPPPVIGPWMRRLSAHGRGTALIFARTETALFFETVWRRATALLFLEGRLHFHRANGVRAPANAGAPSVLCAYGVADADILADSGLAGYFVPLQLPRGVMVMAIEGSWRAELLSWAARQSGPVSLEAVYRAFQGHRKTNANPNWRAKIRQTLQRGPFERVARGRWRVSGALPADDPAAPIPVRHRGDFEPA